MIVSEETLETLKEEAAYLPSWDLSQRQVWDIELLLNGAFSPLEGFLTRADYEGVCNQMRLQDGTLWPIPIALDVTPQFASTIEAGDRIALRHPEGMILSAMTVKDIWEPDMMSEAHRVYATTDEAHPGVFQLFHRTNPVHLGGPLDGLELPPHHSYKNLRHTPEQLRQVFSMLGWKRVVGFQTRNPMHRAHVELTRRAAAEVGANLLIQPVVGRTSPGDIDYFVRVRCYQAVVNRYAPQKVVLSILPLAMRMAGPREAVWHAIIKRNYGCTHFIVGRDHAGPGNNKGGNAFYAPYAAQELTKQLEPELGIQILPVEEMVYVEDAAKYMLRSEVPQGARIASLTGTELRRRLMNGLDIPDWFSYPEVTEELRRSFPPRLQQGFTIFFTGLSGAGKSTLAQILMTKLMEIGTRPVTLLDGDIVRKHLSSELGFSKHDRDVNIRRIGFVAKEITKNRGVALCAPIAPYRTVRREIRQLIGDHGGFVEVYVATPLEVCEARDRKGLYLKAKAGLIRNFTGISDPYEPPETPEIIIDASKVSPEEGVDSILAYLERHSYIVARGRALRP